MYYLRMRKCLDNVLWGDFVLLKAAQIVHIQTWMVLVNHLTWPLDATKRCYKHEMQEEAASTTEVCSTLNFFLSLEGIRSK